MWTKRVLIGALIASSLSGAAVAAPGGQHTELKQGVTFTTAVVAGGMLGGPVGMMLGALGGAYVGEQIAKADEVETMDQSLAQARRKVEDMQQQVLASEAQAAQIQQFALDILDTQVLFSTGSDVLTEPGVARVNALARVLRAYPAMQVRLDGYADPRGTDEYNNVLSHYRADAVRQVLLDAGISEERIELFSHGNDKSRAASGDLKAYAAERRVEVHVSHPRSNGLVMN